MSLFLVAGIVLGLQKSKQTPVWLTRRGDLGRPYSYEVKVEIWLPQEKNSGGRSPIVGLISVIKFPPFIRILREIPQTTKQAHFEFEESVRRSLYPDRVPPLVKEAWDGPFLSAQNIFGFVQAKAKAGQKLRTNQVGFGLEPVGGPRRVPVTTLESLEGTGEEEKPLRREYGVNSLVVSPPYKGRITLSGDLDFTQGSSTYLFNVKAEFDSQTGHPLLITAEMPNYGFSHMIISIDLGFSPKYRAKLTIRALDPK